MAKTIYFIPKKLSRKTARLLITLEERKANWGVRSQAEYSLALTCEQTYQKVLGKRRGQWVYLSRQCAYENADGCKIIAVEKPERCTVLFEGDGMELWAFKGELKTVRRVLRSALETTTA